MSRHTIEPAVGNQSTGQNRTSAINDNSTIEAITDISTIEAITDISIIEVHVRGTLYGPALGISVVNIPSSQLVSIPGVEVATVVLVVVVQTVVHIPVGSQRSWDSEVDLHRYSKTSNATHTRCL